MSWLLNAIYAIGLVCATPWLAWRYCFQNKSRRGWGHKLFGRVPIRSGNHRCVWMHAVSVGEVNLLKPLIEGLKSLDPDLEVVISSSTETGFDLAAKKYPEQTLFFCPMDFTWAIKNVLRRVRPDALILSELEVWPNLIRETERSGAKVAIINARLGESSFRGYQRLSFLLRPVFEKLSLVASQTEAYTERFCQLGVPKDNVSTTGNMKFDNANTDRNNPRSQEFAQLLPSQVKKVFLGGSTQAEEDLLLADAFANINDPELQLVLVPRHPERVPALTGQLRRKGLAFHLRSSGKPISMDKPQDGLLPIMIVDVIGELGAWWGLADGGYVGGSMGSRGGQNMIEPAAYGIPVSFGPNTKNFKQVVTMLLDRKAAQRVHDRSELEAFIRQVVLNNSETQEMAQRARTLVLEQQGVTARTLDLLSQMLDITASTNSGKRSAA